MNNYISFKLVNYSFSNKFLQYIYNDILSNESTSKIKKIILDKCFITDIIYADIEKEKILEEKIIDNILITSVKNKMLYTLSKQVNHIEILSDDDSYTIYKMTFDNKNFVYTNKIGLTDQRVIIK